MFPAAIPPRDLFCPAAPGDEPPSGHVGGDFRQGVRVVSTIFSKISRGVARFSANWTPVTATNGNMIRLKDDARNELTRVAEDWNN